MYVVLAPLVEGVVGEVHEGLVEVLAGRRLVGHCAEPGHARTTEVHLQRVGTGHKDVKPQVELQASNQEWFWDVLLYHRGQLEVVQVPGVLDEEDAFSLGSLVWLNNIRQRLASLPLPLGVGLKVLLFLWKQPCTRIKVKLFREEMPQAVEMLG